MMSASYEDKVKEQAKPYLGPGERVLAALITQPRGTNVAMAGGLAPTAIGGRKISAARRAAEAGGLQLTRPMALALTEGRLVVFKVSPPIAMGKGGDVKELVSAVPLGDVHSIEVKRLLVGKVVIVRVGGAAVKLEAGPGANAKGFAEEFARARAVV
jgi:hypothetical protein